MQLLSVLTTYKMWYVQQLRSSSTLRPPLWSYYILSSGTSTYFSWYVQSTVSQIVTHVIPAITMAKVRSRISSAKATNHFLTFVKEQSTKWNMHPPVQHYSLPWVVPGPLLDIHVRHYADKHCIVLQFTSLSHEFSLESSDVIWITCSLGGDVIVERLSLQSLFFFLLAQL